MQEGESYASEASDRFPLPGDLAKSWTKMAVRVSAKSRFQVGEE